MAGGVGFGGFGGLGGGFGYGNFQPHHHHHHPLYRPSPPLMAIDRFLVSQSHFSQRRDQNSERNGENGVSGNGFYVFYSKNGAVVSYGSGVLPWQPLGEEGLNLKEKESPEEKVGKTSSRGSSGKRVKGGFGYCATLIKGQWSAEEDR